MSTLSHQSSSTPQPTLVTQIPASSWGHASAHSAPESSAPQILPKAQAAPEPEQPESTEELAPDSETSGFAASPPTDPQDDPSDTHGFLQAQRERADRFGHHFKNVAVLSDRPPIQPKLSLSLGLIQSQGSERAGAADGQLEAQLSQSKGGGSPLDGGTRQFMESRFAQDFSGVRVHTDTSAVQMNQRIQAQAFTHGQDIYFGAGKFDTGSSEGKQLLAHELTHTVQQTGSKPLQAKADPERPLAQSGHVPGMLMAYGLEQDANWMQRSAARFQDPGLVIQRSPDPVQVTQSTQGQEQISGGFLDWVLPKELVQAKDMLGTILKGASGVIFSILKNPVGFLRNLVTGLKQGFQNFLGGIGKYLQSGLIGWLTGALGSTGIEMPKDVFSLKGIFSLVMQVLGATWTQVRGRIISAIPGGEQAMAALEEGTEIFQIAMKEGIGGLWEYVKDQFGDLQGQVMGQIKDMVVVQGIQQGIKFILSMLNPVSGLVRAAMAIYDVVKFFIERGSQVASLVEAVIGSIKSVASGAVEQAAKLVESALGRSIPVLIGFLSSVAGLGNLASKVQGIFQKMRQPVDKAVNWLIRKAKDLVLKLGRKLGLVKDDQQAQGPQDGAFSEKDHPKLADQAIAEMKGSAKDAKDYSSLRKTLEAKAKQIEKSYTAKLRSGINLTINFQEAEKDKQDGDLDFEVVIAPNTTRKMSSVEVKARLQEADVMKELHAAEKAAKARYPFSGDSTPMPTWAAVFAAAGKRMTIEKGRGKGKALTLSKVWKGNMDPWRKRIVDSLGQTVKAVESQMVAKAKQQDGNAGMSVAQVKAWIDQQVDNVAKEVINSIKDRELHFVRPTDIPRNLQVKDQKFVIINDNLRSLGLSKTQALYNGVVDKSDDFLRKELKVQLQKAKVSQEVHHSLSLYLGGGSKLSDLLTLFGNAGVPSEPHGMMHELIDLQDISRFLETDQKITLDNDSLEKHFTDNKLKILVGTALSDGDISYKESVLNLVKP